MSRTIAIVEDDKDQRDNYADALQAQGYHVETYGNRPQASAAFRQSLPDLAILDIMLEDEMDGGFDLCRELRTLSSNLPIIFLTARDSDIDRVSGLATGCLGLPDQAHQYSICWQFVSVPCSASLMP